MGFTIHIEVLRKPRAVVPRKSWLRLKDLTDAVKEELKLKGKVVPGTKLVQFESSTIQEHVLCINVCELPESTTVNKHNEEVPIPNEIPFDDVLLEIHAYEVDASEPQLGLISSDGDDEQPACSHWILPSAEFEGLWETLIYDNDIKETLLNYVNTIMFYSKYSVNKNIITWNRLVLLHGPPGTGKTSLCRALAQKLIIRLGTSFIHGELIEINSHSLFSKYFSESGKLVMQMFDKIIEHVTNEKALVMVLIDEVESLTLSRQNAYGGSDPSDSIRVVNTILTQLDKLKRYPNVLIFTTSNITGAIDPAFVDRADIKQYIGLPSKCAIYSVYKTCIEELIRTGLITNLEKSQLVPVSEIKTTTAANDDCKNYLCSINLLHICELSEGLSGRSLRKIPFLAHAHFIKSKVVDLQTFLDCLNRAVIKVKSDENNFET